MTDQLRCLVEDLAHPGAARRIKGELDERGIEIGWLVNNAGFGDTGAFIERDPAREFELLQVNIVALVELTRLFLPAMIARKSGRVLNIGSSGVSCRARSWPSTTHRRRS